MRSIMYPYTAVNLKESKNNSLKDFLSIVDLYGLSHMLCFTNTPQCKDDYFYILMCLIVID